ncbi:hypothetical protein ACS0TY_010590 [Phlomoides rotata]
MAPRKKPKVDRDDHEPKVDRDDHDHEPHVGDDTTTPGVEDTMTRSKRGRMNMYCLFKDRANRVIKDVDFNKLGRHIRENAGSKWRTFKTTLTTEYVYKRIDTPYLNLPPDGSNIDLNVWKYFVISRLSDKFKQMSDEHKELAKLNKWHHNLSRKGYARYASENLSLLSGDNDLDRATLWLKA